MITKAMVKNGLQRGVVKLTVNPWHMEDSTACKIGWISFVFGCDTAEYQKPEDYIANNSLDVIVDEIYETLENFRTKGYEYLEDYNDMEAELREREC